MMRSMRRDGNPKDKVNGVRTMMIFALAIVIQGMNASAAPEVLRIECVSNLDQSKRTGLLQLPEALNAATSTPLLVFVHGMYRDARYGLKIIGAAANRKGWPVLVMNMRGMRTGLREIPLAERPKPDWDPGATNLGAPNAQQDTIDGLEQVMGELNLDPDRVYLLGLSMGGLTGGLVTAKHAERFAAAALIMPVVDVRRWYYESKPDGELINPDIERECGGLPEQAPDDYAARSLFPHAAGLARVPLILVHGNHDATISPEGTMDLAEAIIKHRPIHLSTAFYNGGHEPDQVNFDAILNQLGGFTRQLLDQE